MPSLRAVPPITSSTARTGPPEGTRRSDSGSVFSAMRRMRPSRADEDHVERDVGVVHPEGDRLLALEIEQHAAAFRQFLAEHQAALALGVVGGELDRKGVHAGLADDLERRLAGRVAPATRRSNAGASMRATSSQTAQAAGRDNRGAT